MFIEVLVLSGGATYLMARHRRRSVRGRLQARSASPRKPSGVLGASLRVLRVLRDFNAAIKADGRQRLRLDIDPAHRQQVEQARRANKRNIQLLALATGLAILGHYVRFFSLAGAVAVLYLSREVFFGIWKDFKRGQHFSVFLIGLFSVVGMILTGHLVLAALAGVIGGLLWRVVERVEDQGQRQLIEVFGGHPERVWRLRDGIEVEVDYGAIEPGDLLVVNAGEVIAADGKVDAGGGQVDQHLLTGESQPIEKIPGEPVYAATLLRSGRLVIRVEQAGQATVAAKVGDILNQTQAQPF